MSMDAEVARRRIADAAVNYSGFDVEVANDVAFHMTDWLGELEAYHKFCLAPGLMTDQQVVESIIAFLAHVPGHVNEAAALFSDAPINLSSREAFDAMGLFLTRFTNEAGPDMMTLLGDISIESDGMPFDAAAWDDWLDCVRQVKESRS